MGFLVSPGVDINEIDATNVIPAVSTSIGGLVGNFRWGPAEEVVNVGSEKEMAALFGKPSLTQYDDYYQGAQFLQYGNSLNIYRTVNSSTAKNSSSSSTKITDLTIASAGSGYVQFPTLSVSGSGSNGQAEVTALTMTDFYVTNVGSGYVVGDTFTSTIGTGTEIILTVSAVDNLGKLQGLTVTNAGSLESINASVIDASVTTNFSSPLDPGVRTFNDLAYGVTDTAVTTPESLLNSPGDPRSDALGEAIWTYAGSAGTGARIVPILSIKSVRLINGGSGYSSTPTISITNDTSIRLDGGGDEHLNSPELIITEDSSFSSSPRTFNGDSAAASITASVGAEGLLVKNRDSYDALGSSVRNAAGFFIARCPGAIGDSIKVSIVTNQNFGDGTGAAASNFPSKPGETVVAGAASNSDKEIHIAVIDEDGLFTGTKGAILETYDFVSVDSTALKSDGSSNYYKEIINLQSQFIWIGQALSESDVATASDLNYSLTGGTSEAATDVSEDVRANSYEDAFGDPDQVDINLIIGGAVSATNANKIIQVAEKRKDAIAFVSPKTILTANIAPTTAVSNLKSAEYAGAINSSSYGVLDGSAIYVYDKYNDVYHYIGAAGTIAGLCANTDDIAEPWFSPAGFNRGQLRGVAKLALNPKQNQRDELYKARINPLVSFPGQGTLLFGDKTAQSKPSAFDRINVRRLFIVLEKAIATAAKFQLFELNDQFTRATFRNVVEPFLRGVKGRRGVTDFLVICDETNNTGQVIDSNQFVADIFIKPARSINFITLNFIATRTGVEFSEIAGQ